MLPTLTILYQDQCIVIIDKPAGILVHSHPRFPNEIPLIQRLRDQIGQPVWPVHRLDRQTSGILIFALSPEFIEPMAEALRQGQKTYWAVVRGSFPHNESTTVDTPIKGKEALSIVRCLGRCEEPRCSLLEVLPRTGRNHQVRRHVRDLHHPILHDGDHGDSRVNRWWRENMGLKRLALHAGVLDIPYIDKQMRLHTPLPKDLRIVFEQVSWWNMATSIEPLLVASSKVELTATVK